jgi:hypothetical protein
MVTIAIIPIQQAIGIMSPFGDERESGSPCHPTTGKADPMMTVTASTVPVTQSSLAIESSTKAPVQIQNNIAVKTWSQVLLVIS